MTRLHVPQTLDRPDDMFVFLDKVGLPLPAMARAMSADGLSLSAAGIRFTEAKIDEALGKFEMTTEERLRIKLAMQGHRLIGK